MNPEHEATVSSRAVRAARNESVFRAANDQIEEAAKGSTAMFTEFVCECNRLDCMEPLPLTLIEYEEVRKDPTHFIVRPDHVDAEVEVVVVGSGEGRYVVVEKVGAAGREAAAIDPR